METMTGITAGGSNQQNKITSMRNIGGGYFLHFGTIGANPMRGIQSLRGK